MLLAGGLAVLLIGRQAAHLSAVPSRPILPAVSGATSDSPAPTAEPDDRTLAPPSAAALTEEITRALRDGSTTAQDRAFNELLPRLILHDAAMAGRLALAWEPGVLRDNFLRHVVRLWSTVDVGGAVAWLTASLDDPDRRIAAATSQVAQDDPAGAIELSQLLNTGVDDGSLEHLAQMWAEENPREALDWIVRRPADPQRDRLLARIAHVRAQRDDALLAVVRLWAVRDPSPATAWVAQFPAGPLHTRALAELATARKLR